MPCQPIPLESLRAIAVTGRDARTFLQNQLSSDVNEVSATRGQLSAWHDAKGRVLAFLRVLPLNEGYLLVMQAHVAALVEQRLRMFIFRAKVALQAVPGVYGLAAEAAPDFLASQGLETGAEPLSASCNGSASALRMPGRAGWLIAGDLGAAATSASPAASADWELAELESAIPEVYVETSGRFVSQMLNLERIGAVSFTKGCYPGQEIVARAHHLGRVKRRARLFQAVGEPPAPGDSLADSAGTVVRAAAAGEGCLLMAVVPEDAPGPFALADGRPVTPWPQADAT